MSLKLFHSLARVTRNSTRTLSLSPSTSSTSQFQGGSRSSQRLLTRAARRSHLLNRAPRSAPSLRDYQESPLERRFSTTPPCLVKKRMPPKKAPAVEKKVLLGRPGNNLKIGIVGKSRLQHWTLTQANILMPMQVYQTLGNLHSLTFYLTPVRRTL
jgi:hypothetical protein